MLVERGSLGDKHEEKEARDASEKNFLINLWVTGKHPKLSTAVRSIQPKTPGSRHVATNAGVVACRLHVGARLNIFAL